MMEAQKKVAAAARKHGIAWGRPVGTADDARVIIEIGALFVVLGSEFVAMINQMTTCSAHFDELLSEVGGNSIPVPSSTAKSY